MLHTTFYLNFFGKINSSIYVPSFSSIVDFDLTTLNERNVF
jgi:hypothetical protein